MPSLLHVAVLHTFVLLSLLPCIQAKKQRSSSEWSKMTDADWERVESEWESNDEQENEPPKPAGGGFDIKALQEQLAQANKKGKRKGKKKVDVAEMLGNQPTGGPTMMFATIDYPGCCTEKPPTERLANKWSALLHSAGMQQSAYVVENDIILFSTQAGLHAKEIKEFLLEQPECVAVEWNQVRTPGPAETEEWKRVDAAKKAEKKAEREAKQQAEKAQPSKRRKSKTRRRQSSKTSDKGEL
uniref:Uncharacterized protein n=1 Tax=Chrysotila carterae TaxID=13221 RepID=A0A7S4ETQ5_CHRCT